MSKFRLSKSFSANITLELHTQLSTYVATHNLPKASVIRSSLLEFLYPNPRKPLPTNPLLTNPELLKHATQVKRTVTITTEILDSGVRDDIYNYASNHKLQISSIIRRAVYEHTKPEAPNSLATLDGWGDREAD